MTGLDAVRTAGLVAWAACLGTSCRQGSMHAPPEASSDGGDAGEVIVPVVQKALRDAPMVFHPVLPLVGQETGSVCDVWDIQADLYRGMVSSEECRRWQSAPESAPQDLADATPGEPLDESFRGRPGIGKLLFARSPSGRDLATARRGSRTVKVWRVGRGVPIRSLEVAEGVDGLTWTRAGRLAIASVGSGPEVWDVAKLEDGGGTPDRVGRPIPNARYDRLYPDAAGRFIGYTGSGYVRPHGVMIAGVVLLGERSLPSRLEVWRPWREVRLDSVKWSTMRPTAFFVRTEDSEACPDYEQTLTRVDATWAVEERGLVAARVVTALLPSPDGRFALVATNDAPSVEHCVAELVAEQAVEHGPVLRLWEPDSARGPEVLRGRPAEMAWAPDSALFAVASAGRVSVFEASELAEVASWEGAGPLAFAPDGTGVTYVAAAGPLFHAVPRAAARPVELNGADGGACMAGPATPGFAIDPSGCWSLGAPAPDEPATAYALRRAQDGVTLFIPRMAPRGAANSYTSEGGFASAPPSELAFRLGTDVLRAPIVRASEATFAAPTPYLGERFLRGERAGVMSSGGG